MTTSFLSAFRRRNETPEKAKIEHFRREIIRALRAGKDTLAGGTKESITFVNNVAQAGNYEMLLAIHRCLNHQNSVLSIIRAANEMRDLGYRNGQDMLTQETLAAREKVHAAVNDSGCYALDARRLGALVVAAPHQQSLVLSIIESGQVRDYLSVVDMVEKLEQK